MNLGFRGPQFSRGFDALKVWVSLLAHGRDAYARRIEHDIELTGYLASRVAEHPEFELVSTGLSICCFRYRPAGVDDEDELNPLNERLLTALQVDGRVYPSNAIVDGRYCLRTCIVNFRTEAEDLDRLLDVQSRARRPRSGRAQLDLALIALDLFDAHVDRIAQPVRPAAAPTDERRAERIELEVVAG